MKSLFLLISFTIASSIVLQAQTVYVDVNNSTGIEDGTAAHPFNTIREGMAAASPGQTVFIREGTYLPDESWSGNDHCLYLKAGVKLMGEGAGKTIVDGNIIDLAVSNLSISLEKIGFKEFNFGRGTIAGPFLQPNVIRECKATLIAIRHGSGIPVNDSTPGPIYGFTIENNQMGIEGGIEFKQGAGTAVIKVLNNTCGSISISSGGGLTYLIDNNDIQLGIADKSGACTTTISNNRIADGPIIDRSGGRLDGVEDEIIENNRIVCSDKSPWFADEYDIAGITADSRSATIRNNSIICTGPVSGIIAAAGAPFNVTNNTIIIDEVLQAPADVDNATWGIKNYSGYGTVTGNSIQGGYIGYNSKAGTVEFSGNVIKKSFTGF
ncbi:MAG: hypothetical protein NTV01_05440, partial [Bacteroidia bacterium]|nr:hypothetical protein [Bacteroidia bacterium]